MKIHYFISSLLLLNACQDSVEKASFGAKKSAQTTESENTGDGEANAYPTNPKATPTPTPIPVPAPNPQTTREPVKENPVEPAGDRSAAALKVIAFLKETSGKKTITGQHNKEPNSDPAKWTNYVKATTGETPGLWSGDFLFRKDDVANRQKMIDQAIIQWKAGSLVNIMLHVCPPTGDEDCEFNGDGSVFSKLSDPQWADLMKDGGSLNKAWKARLDIYAGFFQKLKDAGVAPMFRPFHEMNQVGFWWGGRKGSGGTAKLFEMTHDYLVKTKGLTNIVWTWDIQDLDWSWAEYKPRADTWDIMALDVYNPDRFTQKKYDEMIKVAGNKPIAIGECEFVPTEKDLAGQPRWVFFMAWAEMVKDSNSASNVKAIYTSPKVLNQGSLSGYKQ